MNHQSQEEVGRVQFHFHSQRIAATWLVNYSLACWREPLQPYQGKRFGPQIRVLLFLMHVCEVATEVEILCAAWNVLLLQHLNHCQRFALLSSIIRSARGGTIEYVKLTFHGAEDERSQLVPPSARVLSHPWHFNLPQSQINSEFHPFFWCKCCRWLRIVCSAVNCYTRSWENFSFSFFCWKCWQHRFRVILKFRHLSIWLILLLLCRG